MCHLKVHIKVLPVFSVLPVCTVAAGLRLQMVVVGGVRDVAQSHAVLPDWAPVLQETRVRMEMRSGHDPNGWGHRQLQWLTVCLASCCCRRQRCSSSSLSGRRYSSASSTSPRSSELSRREKKRLSVGLGRSPCEWGKRSGSGFFCLNPSHLTPQHVTLLHTHPTPYLYHQVSGWISGQLGKLGGQLSEGGTTGRIDHPTWRRRRRKE